MENIKVRSTNFGIAYRFGNIIEINPLLKKYPKYYKEVLKHEKGHKPNTKMDFMHDLKDSSKLSKESLKFTLHHPITSLQTLAPIWFDKEWNYNTFAIVMWLGIMFTIGMLIV